MEPKQIVFRSYVTGDGSTPFLPEAGRYRLYISLACPWASRCYLTIKLKGLDEAIPVTIVHYHLGEKCCIFLILRKAVTTITVCSAPMTAA
jgi:glutathionyl-hydroquinone reductase